jgi:hypothetical protein
MKITIKKSSSGSEYSKKAGKFLLFSDKNKNFDNNPLCRNFVKIRTAKTSGA